MTATDLPRPITRDDIVELATEVAEDALKVEYGGCQYPAARAVVSALADAGLLRPEITHEMVVAAEAAIIESVFGKEQVYIDYIDIAREALEAALEETS